MHRFLFVTGILIAGIHCLSAQVLVDLAQMRDKYPGEIGVFLEDRQDVLIDFKGDSIIATENQKEDMLYLTEQAKEFSEKKIYYSYFIKVGEINAETLVPTDKKYKTVKVTNFKDSKEYSSGIFYDDLMSKSFVFPALQAGARTMLTYSRDIIDPRFLSSFYFGSGVPVELSELNITVNKNIKLNYKLFNTDSINIQHSTKEKGNYVTHTFKALDLKGYPYEEDAPSASYYRPHIVYYLEESNKNDKKPILATVNDLHNWYYSFVKDIVESSDNMDDLKKVVDSLVKDTPTELEKVKKIYYWVQDHISYVAIENGYRGFIPHKAPDTFVKRYGDCKDMATIIYTMLKIAGIKSHLTWIGSRDIPYKYSDLPCPAVDDHMITTYMQGDKVYFLDATSRYSAFGQPASHIQGKEALVSLEKGKYVVKQVPIVEASKNLIIDTSILSIDGKLLRVEGSATMTNYPKIFTTYRLADLTSYKKQKEYLTGYLTRGNNKFLLDTVTVQNVDEKEKPLVIRFKGSVGDYVKTIDNEIYINLHLEKLFFNDRIDTTRRKAPKENTYCYEADNITILNIPKGYQLEELPKNVSRKDDLFSFNITYEKKDNTIICRRTVVVNYLLLEKSKFKEWNKMVDELSVAYRDAVILKSL